MKKCFIALALVLASIVTIDSVSAQNSSLWKFIGSLRPVVSTWRIDAPGGLRLEDFPSCSGLGTDGDGDVDCSGGGTSTGDVIAIGDLRYVEIAGDTMTGALTIQGESLTASGAYVAVKLASSGSLIVENTMSGNALIVSSLNCSGNANGGALTVTSGGVVECSDDDSAGSVNTGAILTAGDPRWVNVAGDTMTGSLIVQGANATASGVYAIESLASSGTLTVETTMSGDTLTVSSLKECDIIDTDVNGLLACGSETDPITGAITGIVKADGGGNISAATSNTDYLPPIGPILNNGDTSNGYIDFLEDSDNGTNYVRLLGPPSTDTVTINLGAAAGIITTDVTACTDIEGNGLSIATSTLNWSASGIAGHDVFTDFVANEHIDWTGAADNFETSGSMSGDSLVISSLDCSGNANGGALTVTSGGAVICSDDDSTAGGGLTEAQADGMYVNVGGDTMTGALVIQGADLTASGAYAAVKLASSGSLVVEGTASGDILIISNSIGLTGTRVPKGWFTDLEVTNAIVGDITGNAATCTTASAGDAAVDFFGAGVDAVTDATTCTDIEGTGLSIATSTLNWSASGIAGHDVFTDFVANEHIDWTAAADNFETSGTMSGDTLTLSSLKSCDTIDTDVNGLLACGTDDGAGGGLTEAQAEGIFVNQGGDTMTGALLVQAAISGSSLQIDGTAAFSSTVTIIEGALTDSTVITDDIKNATITGDDMNANIGGRSITLTGASPDTLDADSELYTDTKCIWFEDPTAADDFESIWVVNGFAATITKMWCESDHLAGPQVDLQVDDGTPADVNGTDLDCDTTPALDESMGGDPTLADGDRLDLIIDSGTGGWLSVCWTFTYDD